MKGHLFVLAIVIGIVTLLPVFALGQCGGEETAAVDTTPQEDVFLVNHTDASAQSEMAAYELTLYELMGTMAPDRAPQALQAQAVACYTSFCYQMQNSAAVTSTTLSFPETFCEEYWKMQWGEAFDSNIAAYRQALDAVFGKTVVWEDKPIMAVYHAMNGGVTESAEVLWGTALPYLISVESPADAADLEQLSTVTVTVEEAKTALSALCGADVGETNGWFTNVHSTDAGTVTHITVGQTVLSGEQIQRAFSLPSASFEAVVQNDEVIFTVRGRGHFAGLSACGAQSLAQSGKTYEEILLHYYPGTAIR